jgi:predicted porin
LLVADTNLGGNGSGGFFREQDSYNYGMYVGFDANTSTGLAHSTGFMSQSNAYDLFLAGNTGMKWGARLHMASSKNEIINVLTNSVARDNSAMGLGLGMMQGDLGVYANIDLSDKSTGKTGVGGLAADTSELKPSFNVGAGYDMGGIHYYAQYNTSQLDETVAGVSSTTKANAIYVGAGRAHELAPGVNLWTSATYVNTTNETTSKTTASTLPLLVAVEGQVSSWLTLRGSVTQNFLLNTTDVDGKVNSSTDTTGLGLGASVVWGKLQIDGTLGGTANATSYAINGNNLLGKIGVVMAF